jgi:hypothetical protein
MSIGVVADIVSGRRGSLRFLAILATVAGILAPAAPARACRLFGFVGRHVPEGELLALLFAHNDHFQRIPKNASAEDWTAYGHAALKDYEAAFACFHEGLARYGTTFFPWRASPNAIQLES